MAAIISPNEKGERSLKIQTIFIEVKKFKNIMTSKSLNLDEITCPLATNIISKHEGIFDFAFILDQNLIIYSINKSETNWYINLEDTQCVVDVDYTKSSRLVSIAFDNSFTQIDKGSTFDRRTYNNYLVSLSYVDNKYKIDIMRTYSDDGQRRIEVVGKLVSHLKSESDHEYTGRYSRISINTKLRVIILSGVFKLRKGIDRTKSYFRCMVLNLEDDSFKRAMEVNRTSSIKLMINKDGYTPIMSELMNKTRPGVDNTIRQDMDLDITYKNDEHCMFIVYGFRGGSRIGYIMVEVQGEKDSKTISCVAKHTDLSKNKDNSSTEHCILSAMCHTVDIRKEDKNRNMEVLICYDDQTLMEVRMLL
jgi:hypothetical protein